MDVKLSASHPHTEDLESGRVLAPGEVVCVEQEEVQERARVLIDAGALFILDSPSEPFKGYDELSADDVVKRLAELGDNELAAAKTYEAANKNRKTIVHFQKEEG